MKLVFLLEEQSMKCVLESLLPDLLPIGVDFQLIPHEGKSNLQASIPRKLRGWLEPNVRFIILHDQDSNQCMALKDTLMTLAREAGRPDTLVRIVCAELESWFLGDLYAVGAAYEKDLSGQIAKAKFRNPDRLTNAKEELRKLIPTYQMVSGAQAISAHMQIERNNSYSFRVFVEGVKRVCAGLSAS